MPGILDHKLESVIDGNNTRARRAARMARGITVMEATS